MRPIALSLSLPPGVPGVSDKSALRTALADGKLAPDRGFERFRLTPGEIVLREALTALMAVALSGMMRYQVDLSVAQRFEPLVECLLYGLALSQPLLTPLVVFGLYVAPPTGRARARCTVCGV